MTTWASKALSVQRLRLELDTGDPGEVHCVAGHDNLATLLAVLAENKHFQSRPGSVPNVTGI